MMRCQTTRQRLEKGPRKKQLERNENWRKEMVQLAASDCKGKRCTVSSLAFFFSLAIHSQKAMLKIKNCYNQVLLRFSIARIRPKFKKNRQISICRSSS
jgi:hypothetical protein